MKNVMTVTRLEVSNGKGFVACTNMQAIRKILDSTPRSHVAGGHLGKIEYTHRDRAANLGLVVLRLHDTDSSKFLAYPQEAPGHFATIYEEGGKLVLTFN